MNKEQKHHYSSYGREFGNHFNILNKGRRWVVLKDDPETGTLVENFSQKAYPVTAYRCSGTVKSNITLQQFCHLCFDLQERRKWDGELTEKCKTIEQLDKNATLDLIVYNSVLGGLVTGRTYVDVR